MNAYELAYKLWQEGLPYVEKAATMLRQQADELDKVVPQLVKANGLIENLRLRIAELEKDLHMVQRHYDQLNLPDGYVVVCVHCAKELKIEFDEPTDLEAKIAKYEEVLQAIANDYHELSDHKIEVQVRNHKKWAREALE